MLDKRHVRQSFDRAARRYEQFAVVQNDIAGRLIERVAEIGAGSPRTVLDLGCGTGHLTRALTRRFRGARVVGIDLSSGMASTAASRRGWLSRMQFLCADMERLPVAAASIDLVVSNLALQWCDATAVFAEVARVLRPGGHFLFSTFGPDTLKELRAAWTAADRGVHVHDFVDMHVLGDALLGIGFRNPVTDTDLLQVSYDSVRGVMDDLRGIGANNADGGRRTGLMGKNAFARFRDAYEAQAVDGRIPASYEVIFGFGRAPEHAQLGAADVFAVPVSQIGRRR